MNPELGMATARVLSRLQLLKALLEDATVVLSRLDATADSLLTAMGERDRLASGETHVENQTPR